MPPAPRIHMLICLGALASMLGGCVSTANGPRATFARKPERKSSGSDVVPVSFEEAADEPPLLVPEPRTFPRQGWWCSDFDEWLSPERIARGYTIVLPGVEGTS